MAHATVLYAPQAREWGLYRLGREVKRSLTLGVAALVMVLGASCATGGGGGGGGGPTAPLTISGVGQYDFRVTEPSVPDLIGGNGAAFALSLSGDTYSGTIVSENSGPANNVVLTVSGATITSVYANDAGLVDPSTGFEITTSDVLTSTVTDATQCPGTDALEISIAGSYTVASAPSLYEADRVVWTICDAAAAAYFG